MLTQVLVRRYDKVQRSRHIPVDTGFANPAKTRGATPADLALVGQMSGALGGWPDSTTSMTSCAPKKISFSLALCLVSTPEKMVM